MSRLTEHSLLEASRISSPRSRREPRVGLRGGKGKRYTLAERLAARTVKGPDCWIVQGYQLPRNGYVQISQGGAGGPALLAHRVAWELAHEQTIPEGFVVAHTCDRPNCVAPQHLVLTTQRQNILDSIHKGRYNVFGRQRLNVEQVREIKRRAASGELQRVIAADFGIARNTVSGIVNGASWLHSDETPLGPLAAVLERVPHVLVPVRGDLHLSQQGADNGWAEHGREFVLQARASAMTFGFTEGS